MRNYKLALICAFLTASCAHSPAEITVHKPQAVEVPADLKTRCASELSDGSIGQELTRLSDLAKCQFNKQDALSEWESKLPKSD